VAAWAALASLVVLRPIAMRHLRAPVALRTGTAALVGARAVVLERVDDTGGRVKIGVEEWSARAFFDGHVIEAGARDASRSYRSTRSRGSRRTTSSSTSTRSSTTS
jgi:membrane protein implicated in regulation of membrane protease activity